MGLQNPAILANEKYNSLIRASCEMIGAATGKQIFPTADHIQAVKMERQYGKEIGMS